ncbi:MAG: transposase [Candidatus Acidiferrales bacterium]
MTQDSSREVGRRSAAVPAALSNSPANGPNVRRRRKLPHFERSGATYFVTFRLADSMPRAVLERFEMQKRLSLATGKRSARSVERYLDAGAGKCHLRKDVAADSVANVLRHFDGERYRLAAWCVMPNHVHVIFQPFNGHKLADILHTWKSYSAKTVNRQLGLSGRLWQREYYDRLIRDQRELARAIAYVAENPKKARLDNWLWVWVETA